MKVLTLWQPWATLWVYGEKLIETRDWGTDYRGYIAVHASKQLKEAERVLCYSEPFSSALERCGVEHAGKLPLGAILGRVNLIACRRMKPAGDEPPDPRLTEKERAFGNYATGRFAWVTDSDRILLPEPFPHRGAQGLRDLPADIAARLR